MRNGNRANLDTTRREDPLITLYGGKVDGLINEYIDQFHRPLWMVEREDLHSPRFFPLYPGSWIRKISRPKRKFRLVAEILHGREESLEVFGVQRHQQIEIGREPHHAVQHKRDPAYHDVADSCSSQPPEKLLVEHLFASLRSLENGSESTAAA